MKTLFIVSLSFLLSNIPITAQEGWFWQNPQIPSNKLYSGDINELDNLIVVGDAGLMVSINTNTLDYSYSYLQSSQNINDIQFIDNQNGWLITSDEFPWFEGGKIFKTQDGGINWFHVHDFPEPLADLYVIDSLNILILDWGETLLRSSDGGVTWTQHTFNNDLNKIEFVTENIGFIVGYGTTLLKTTDKGESWYEVNNNQLNWGLLDIKFYNEMHGFITGEYGYIYETEDGGNNWTGKFITAGMYNIYSILLFDTQKIILVGRIQSSSSYDSIILYSPDSGTSWFEIGQFDYNVNGTIKISNEKFITFSDKGIINVYSFGDSTWTRLDQDIRENIVSISIINQDLGWSLSENGKVLKTTNSGNNWTINFDNSQPGDKFFDIFFSDINNGWITSVRNHQLRGFYTTDGGINWNLLPGTYPGEYKAIFFISDEIGWLARNHELILKTTDGGTTWQEQGITGIYYDEGSIEEIQFIDENLGYAGGGYISGIDPYGSPIYYSIIMKTTDGGTNWEFLLNEEGDYIVSICFIDANVGYALKYDKLLKTTNGGGSFMVKSTPLYSTNNKVYFLNANDGWIAGRMGKIYSTSNSGNTWIPQNALTRNDINDIYFMSDSLGWFGGDNGSIFRLGTPLVNDVSTLPIITHYKLEQNYPNPFNPTTSIRYAVSSQQFVSLKLYDVLGNEIATLVNEEKPAGNYEVKFDGDGLTSGIYFYQLRAGNFIETKKMVLIR